MKQTSEHIYSSITEKVALSFGNILETLFHFRKWDPPCKREQIELCIRSYLENQDPEFWSARSVVSDEKRSEMYSSCACREIIRLMDETLDIRNRTRSQIREIFSEPERFSLFMDGKVKFAFSHSSQEEMAEEKQTQTISARKGSVHPDSRGGLPRIGPRIRLFGANLSRAQEKANLEYWQEHQEDLYNG
jgi:hypothetical protein